MDELNKRDKGKRKRHPTPSSSYESDPCFSESSSGTSYIKGPSKYKIHKKSGKEKGESVSNWEIHKLEKLGISYKPETSDISKLIEIIKTKCKSWKATSKKVLATSKLSPFPDFPDFSDFPDFVYTLEEFTKRVLNFTFVQNVLEEDVFALKPIFMEQDSQMEVACELMRSIRKEHEEILDSIDKSGLNKRDMFETWFARIRDFLSFHKRFLRDQRYAEEKESRFVYLFMAFSRIFFLDPEFGNMEVKKMVLGGSIHSSVPDVRFVLNGSIPWMVLNIFTVMLTEVKKYGIEKDSSEDDKEKFDIRKRLPGKVLAQHGGELLADKENSLLNPYVLGSICMGTEVIFTYLEMTEEHFRDIRTNGESTKHSSLISYTKPYNFLLEKERNEILPVMFLLGSLQSCSFENYRSHESTK